MMQVDSSMMNYYPGFEIPPYPTYERHALSPKTAFDFMFISGMHGYGRWMMKQSVPPFLMLNNLLITVLTEWCKNYK